MKSLISFAALLLIVSACSDSAVIATQGDSSAHGTGGSGAGGSTSRGTGGSGPGGTGGSIGGGTGGSVVTDAGSDTVSTGCPAQVPISGGACSGTLTCTYATLSCCGLTMPLYSCSCQNGHFSCLPNECNFVCPSDAGAPADAASGDGGGGTTCGDMTCASGTVCVRRQVVGGVCNLPSADGGCPPGTSPGGTCCVNDPTYRCATRPTSCTGPLTCDCATSAGLCQTGFSCATPATAPNEVDCTQYVP